ncbi:MAG: hypothetical protein ABIW82_13420 [Dokdonella sp.]
MLPISGLIFSAIVSASPAAKSSLAVSLCNAGDHQQFESITCDIELKNSGSAAIRIFDARAISRWDSIERETTVPAHGTAYLRATVGINDSVGFAHRSFQFKTDEPGLLSSRGAEVQAFVSSVLDDSAPAIDFGVVKLSDDVLPVKTIALSSREVSNFRILEIMDKPDYLDASIAQDGRTLKVSVEKNAPWGLRHERVKLKINAPQQREAWIKVDANVQGDVVPDTNPVLLGLMRTNNRNEVLIRLSSISSKTFKIGSVDIKGIKGSTKIAPCTPDAAGCRVVKLAIAKDQIQGRLSGILSVELPDFKQTLPIELGGGLLLAPEVKIRDMNKENEKALQDRGNLQSAATPPAEQKKMDVKQAIEQAIEKKDQEVAPPPGNGPLLRWSVAHQVGYHGYIIYRADAQAGPYFRVSRELIPVASNEGTDTGSYQWRDNLAESGKTYWYSIGLVKDDGDKVALSGGQKVTAK